MQGSTNLTDFLNSLLAHKGLPPLPTDRLEMIIDNAAANAAEHPGTWAITKLPGMTMHQMVVLPLSLIITEYGDGFLASYKDMRKGFAAKANYVHGLKSVDEAKVALLKIASDAS